MENRYPMDRNQIYVENAQDIQWDLVWETTIYRL